MEFKTQIGAVTARQAADELWKLVVSINGVLPPSMPLTLVYVRTGTNAGTTEELPATKDELYRRFPDIVSQVEQYSERQDGRADLDSQYEPELWRFHLYSRDGATHNGLSCSLRIGPKYWWHASHSVGWRVPGSTWRDQRRAFAQLVEKLRPVSAYFGPGFKHKQRWSHSADTAFKGYGLMTYIASPDRDVGAYDWAPTDVYPWAEGYMFEVPTEDADIDPDLFQKIIEARDRMRRNGDLLRRRFAVSCGEDPDNLPPPPPDPEYVLDDA